jgi:DNA-binding XRE family transcriptional regulator
MKTGKEYIESLTDWDNFKGTLGLTQGEWDEINLKVKIVGEIVAARRSQEITQQALEELSGVRQPVIARLESNVSDPQLTTILKILRPLGKTLAVVDMPKSEAIVGEVF